MGGSAGKADDLRPAHASRFDESFQGCSILIETDAEYYEVVAVLGGLGQPFELRQLGHARRAPGGPEVDEDVLASQSFERKLPARERRHREVRGRCTDTQHDALPRRGARRGPHGRRHGGGQVHHEPVVRPSGLHHHFLQRGGRLRVEPKPDIPGGNVIEFDASVGIAEGSDAQRIVSLPSDADDPNVLEGLAVRVDDRRADPPARFELDVERRRLARHHADFEKLGGVKAVMNRDDGRARRQSAHAKRAVERRKLRRHERPGAIARHDPRAKQGLAVRPDNAPNDLPARRHRQHDLRCQFALIRNDLVVEVPRLDVVFVRDPDAQALGVLIEPLEDHATVRPGGFRPLIAPAAHEYLDQHAGNRLLCFLVEHGDLQDAFGLEFDDHWCIER